MEEVHLDCAIINPQERTTGGRARVEAHGLFSVYCSDARALRISNLLRFCNPRWELPDPPAGVPQGTAPSISGALFLSGPP